MKHDLPTITAESRKAAAVAAARTVEDEATGRNVTTTRTDKSSDVSSIILPRNNKEYGTKEYWEHRFSTEESFEWLLSYPQIKHQLEPILLQYCRGPSITEQQQVEQETVDVTYTYDKSLVRILVVGCGNAPFSCDLYDDGYTNIMNIDYSPVVIQNMQEWHSKTRPQMQWVVMDMTRMDAVPDAAFHVVIDKAAMDAIMTHEQDVWNPNPTVIRNAYQMCGHISRIMPPDGTFVQISLTQPHFRNKYLLHLHDIADLSPSSDETDNDTTTLTMAVSGPTSTAANNTYCTQFGWTVNSEVAGRSDDTISTGMFGHYLYIMRKGGIEIEI